MENVLVVGGGGREHALVWKLSQSDRVKQIFAIPGSCAIETIEKASSVSNIEVKNFQQVAKFCKDNHVSLVVIGPEDPLANGIADALTAQGINVFGPVKNAAKIESDKEWAKSFMDKYNVPTARWKSFSKAGDAKKFIQSADFPALVVKASGLAAGKGVVVAAHKNEACAAVDEILTEKKFGGAGETVVVEELLTGEEVSVLAFCDGQTVKAMLPAQDHKRIFDGDKGPNTGGMGAYCPCTLIDDVQMNYVRENVLERTLKGFQKENIKYTGVLYAGLMLTENGPKVLEFNCRFGDPETEVILPLLQTDLFEIMRACCAQTLNSINLTWRRNSYAAGVVMASRGYPETSSKGQAIRGIERATKFEKSKKIDKDVDEIEKKLVFHCGTTVKDGDLVTNGGRVLIAVAVEQQLAVAAANATKMCEIIEFEGKQFRRDIAHKGIARSILKLGKLTYKASGVDISAGNDLVTKIKSATGSTARVGTVGNIGGFGGLFDLKLSGFKDPLLVSGTDGVGTKLKIAQEIQKHDSIGIDLVAMCVNDILAHGAEPLFFLDYFACGALDVEIAKEVVSGVADGCRQAGCALIGGETAEMPDMYTSGEYDLAGFCVGAVERANLLPYVDKIKPGDVIIGLPSSGVHSNGFSLVRKVMKLSGTDYNSRAVFSTKNATYGDEFLEPTKIYVKSVLAALKTKKVRAFAHITGGGLLENVPRVLNANLGVELDAAKWKIQPLFAWLAATGEISEFEMLRTFNCGLGGVLIVEKGAEDEILRLLSADGATIIGKVTERIAETEQVLVKNFDQEMEKLMRPFVPKLVEKYLTPKKKVGVLISGSGTNLQALIDATKDETRQMGAEIVLVISNKPDVEGLKRAERAQICTKVISHKDFPDRANFDGAMTEQLKSFGVEIVCLAGFMRILSGEFVREWRGRLINVHPSLLPLFKGTHAQRQALEAGVRVSGCSVHFVEEDIDAGAIIVQETVQIDEKDTEDSLIERIKCVEHVAFPKALKFLATGKVALGMDNKLLWS